MKKQYIQPTMTVETIEMEAQPLAGSLLVCGADDGFIEDKTDFLSNRRGLFEISE